MHYIINSYNFEKIAVKCLPYYADYFDMKYPLPKLDMIPYTDMAMGKLIFCSKN